MLSHQLVVSHEGRSWHSHIWWKEPGRDVCLRAAILLLEGGPWDLLEEHFLVGLVIVNTNLLLRDIVDEVEEH